MLRSLLLTATVTLTLVGCSGSEPSNDEGVGGSAQAATEHAPEDAEVGTL